MGDLGIERTPFGRQIFGVISKDRLKIERRHRFELWKDDLVLFWNDGVPSCFRNYCPHMGMPLHQASQKDNLLRCSFHGWTYDLTNGSLVHAPLNKKKLNCRLVSVPTFIRGGIVFVSPSGINENEEALFANIVEGRESKHVDFDAPFFLTLNSSLDFAHHNSHRLFGPLYGFYRSLYRRKNPMGSSYTPVMLEESSHHFKYRISETSVEIECRRFCSEYHDPIGQYRWQFFVTPYSPTKTRYLMTLDCYSKNVIQRQLVRLAFKTYLSWVLLPEDQHWVREASKNWSPKLNLTEQDFGLRNYLKKFPVSEFPHKEFVTEVGLHV